MATGTFTGTGGGTAVAVIGPKNFDLSIFGTFVATVQLQRRRPGDVTWRVVQSYTAGVEETGQLASGTWETRLECTAYTSGTVSWELSAQ